MRDMLREFTNVGHGKLSSDQIDTLLETRKKIDRLCQAISTACLLHRMYVSNKATQGFDVHLDHGMYLLGNSKFWRVSLSLAVICL